MTKDGEADPGLGLPHHVDRTQPASSAEPPLPSLGMEPLELCSVQPQSLYSLALPLWLAQGPI